MTGPGIALGAVWLVWLFSWLLAAGWANAARTRQSGAAQLMHGVFTWAGAFLLFARPASFGPLLNPAYPPVPILGWCALAFVVVGLGWAWWARIHLGRQWSAAVTLKEDHELIRSGPYRVTRHPIYTGLLLALLASAVIEDSWAAPLGFALLALGFVVKIRQEERMLGAAFGAQYAAYRAEVPALVPRFPE